MKRVFLSKELGKQNLFFILVSSILLLSCKKEGKQRIPEADFAKTVKSNRSYLKRIKVFSTNELYAAVNDPGNEGTLVELAPGTYILNADYPNGGRLELQKDMALEGLPGSPDSVVIDASSLPASSFTPPKNVLTARTGAIRIGRGFNSIEWLTAKGNATSQALSVIDTDNIGDSVSHISVAYSIITGGRIGIDIRNPSTVFKGRTIEADIRNNEVLNNLVQQGQGIEIQNNNGATGAVIHANLEGNYIHGNKVGLRGFNNTNINFGTINIVSHADRFEGNGIGINLFAAINQFAVVTTNDNSLSFDAHGSSIQDNRGVIPPEITDSAPGGMYVAAGFSANSGPVSNNTLQIDLFGCTLSNNNGPDIKAYGYFSLPGSLYGSNNKTTVNLNGVSAKAVVIAVPSDPTELAGSNTVNIVR